MRAFSRYALCALCLGLAGLLLAGHCDAAEKKLNLRLGHPMTKGDQVSLGWLKFSELLEQKSGGSIKLKVYGDCILGSDRVTTEGAQKGSLSMSSCSTGNLSLFAPDFLLFDMPYVIDPMDPQALQKLFTAMDSGPLGKHYEKILNDINLKLICFGDVGYRDFQMHNKNISTIDGLKNIKVRITDSIVEMAVAKALGMYPIPMPWGETVTAMRQGTVDAMAINNASMAALGDVGDVAKYLIDTKHNYYGHVLVMNLDLWKSLTDKQRAIIEEAAAEAVAYERALSAKINVEAYDLLKSKGVTINMCSTEDYARLKELTKGVWEEFRSKVSPEAYALFMDAMK
ncbi:TRAP transporter substrate-binding protein [uncultured Mailhella sp.]|uniref:TRAP transporter substrate-binding protein n=1 Tax=uncultured Mailhella sp. TaxID=1981031 RepID=UPI0026361CE6|nr:TRAP transporter substrate-binding protein [uncultured Mailhella sp.]